MYINSRPEKVEETKLIKLVVFTIGNLMVALHIDSVQKIISYSPLHNSGLSHLGIIHLNEQEITAIDLHKLLFKSPQERYTSKNGKLVIAKKRSGELFGILVDETPSLLDLPLKNFRVIPDSYRRADTLEIASHVIVIPQEKDQKSTIFLLDPERLF